MFWSGQRIFDEVMKVVEANKDLSSKAKINPCGVDIGASSVERIEDNTVAFIQGDRRELDMKTTDYKPQRGFFILKRGVHIVHLNVAVKIPVNAIGLSLPRSTLNRLGVIKSETAVFDPGYEGFGVQTVYIPIKELRIAENEPWFQFMVADAEKTGQTYKGRYQREGL
nr:hypothetical protein [Candidatus Njordarchaeota archaeon]